MSETPEDWPRGTGNPARTALAAVGVHTLDDLTRWTRAEVAALHGVGPKALGVLDAALAARGLTWTG
jgi:hypothetical protein